MIIVAAATSRRNTRMEGLLYIVISFGFMPRQIEGSKPEMPRNPQTSATVDPVGNGR
jgi:hypothetical protein